MRLFPFLFIIICTVSFSQDLNLRKELGTSFKINSAEEAENYADLILEYNNRNAYLNAQKCVDATLKSIEFARKYDLKEKETELLLSLAKCKIYQSDNDSAYTIISSLYNNQPSSKKSAVKVTQMMGSINIYLKDYDKALEHYLEAVDQCDKNLESEKASIYANIGHLFYALNDEQKSRDYLEKAKVIAEPLKDTAVLVSVYNVLGIWEKRNGNFEESVKLLKKGLIMAEEVGNMERVSQMAHNISNTYFRLEKDELAWPYFRKSFEISKQSGSVRSQAISYHTASLNYYFAGEVDTALMMAQKALDLSNSINDHQVMIEAYAMLAEIYQHTHKYEKAMEHLELAYVYKDTFYNNTQSKNARELEAKYNEEKMELQFELEKQRDEEIQAEKLQSRERLLWLAGVIILIVILSLFLVFRKNKVIKSKNEEIKIAYDEIEVRNNEIMDSINYAKRIQNAILPPAELIKSTFPDSFVLYMPKDVVAGDFYWFKPLPNNGAFFAAADCTGHGVPGAMVSVVCNNNLNRSVNEFGISDPGKILDSTRDLVVEEFEKADKSTTLSEASKDEIKDGMDIALIKLEQNENDSNLEFAGAYSPLWVIRKNSNEVEEIKGNKQPVGKFSDPKPFTTQNLKLNSGDMIYLFTDGFADQFGGDKGKKMKSKVFKELLASLKNDPVSVQKDKLEQEFNKWKGEFEQVDDVCVIGIRI